MEVKVKYVLSLILCLLVLSSCSAHKYRSEFDFANKLAKEDLWKEAYFRWLKFFSAGNNTAAVHNNMAVALEKMGKFSEAEIEYQKALEIDPKNTFIKSNYDRLKKFLEKDKSEKDEK